MSGAANQVETKREPTCSGCPFFLSPPTPPKGFDLGQDINRRFSKGTCRRFPAHVHREPHEVCGDHPELVVLRPDVIALLRVATLLAHPVMQADGDKPSQRSIFKKGN